jgi:hypothetical protein
VRTTLRMLGAASVVALFVAAVSLPAQADETYPSWADVEAARSTTATTQAAVGRITGLLSGLEATAAELGDAAVVANGAAAEARAASGTAAAQAALLASRLTLATEKASAANAQLGLLGAQLYRAGATGIVTRLLFSADGGGTDLLYQLGVTTRLGEATAGIRQRALTQANAVQSMEKQAAAAATERDRLARTATARATAAATARRAADDQLAAQAATADLLVTQLASLKNSTAATERSYLAGVAADEAYKQQQAQAERAAAAARVAQAAAAQAAAGQSVAGQGAGSGGSTGATDSGTGGGAAPAPGAVVDPAGARAYASSAVSARGWGQGEYGCLVSLWNRESGWRVDAYNAGSGAYGIPQSLPGSKMASAGSDWRTNAATQINWGLGYIGARYGAPCGAWAHSESVGWY